MGQTITLGALQPLHAVERVVRRTRNDAAGRHAHFMRYNIKAATYDEEYCHRYAEEYLRYLDGWLRRAAARGVDFLLLPEFVFEAGVIAAPLPEIGDNSQVIADALRLYSWAEALFIEQIGLITRDTGMMVGASIPSAREGWLFNAGIILDRGAVLFRYEKVHLAPGDEEDHFTAGNDYPVAETRLGRFAFNICYDIQFPEAFACCAANGAEVVLHPSMGYTLPDEDEYMGRNRLRVRASDHYCAVVYSSFAPASSWYPGHSQVIAQNGTVLDELPGRHPGLASGQVEIGRKRSWPGDAPDAPDRKYYVRQRRRPGSYGALVR